MEGISVQQKEPAQDLLETLKPAVSSFKETLENLPKQSYMDKSNIGIKSSILNEKPNGSVMKNIAEILKK